MSLNNNPIIFNKNIINPLIDISKSLLNFDNKIKNKSNPYIISLHNSKQNTNYLYNSSNITFKKSLEIIDDNLNMTIQNILDNMKKRRITNNSINSKIIRSLDNDPYLDNSNNIIIKYNSKTKSKNSIDMLLNQISTKEKYKLTQYKTSNNFKENVLKNYRSKSFYFPEEKTIPHIRIPTPVPIIKKKKININVEINNLDDILKLIDDYPLKIDIEYNINMNAIHNIKRPLLELKSMIGMKKLKNSIVDQILYFIQEFHKLSNTSNDFMHTVIYGPPGTGKTEIAKIIGKIFSKLGILSKNYFKKVTRADLIAGYLGQTALKTRDVIKNSLGGVLFIDEAYALGNSEKRDSFAKECIDTLCEGLSDYKNDLMVIIAGYEKELKDCFFAYNQGLDSRFNWRFNTDDYSFDELFLIFKKKVYDIQWKLDDTVKNTWFENKMDYFKFYGRDIETLLAKVKIAHGRRVFCLLKEEKMIINLRDLNKGYDMFLDNNEVKSRKDNISTNILNQMYC
jgi:SpoVK/Ycf46/Vps4 family AAA+-type ATPase